MADDEVDSLRREEVLDSLCEGLQRAGINQVRNRVRGALIHREPREFNWQGTSGRTPKHFFDDARLAMKKYGIRNMPLFQPQRPGNNAMQIANERPGIRRLIHS